MTHAVVTIMGTTIIIMITMTMTIAMKMRIKKREQTLLSIGAGLVPCTGALLIMLFALSADLIWEGVLLVAAISFGMAVASSAIGIVCIFARSYVAQRMDAPPSTSLKVALGAEVAGALAITTVGVLFLSAAAQTL